ncbi:MAG: DUF732 domain-containing protein [Mycobacterium sp.]|nr:DUF732 domain-containing protein [Mycobacterium sp.]
MKPTRTAATLAAISSVVATIAIAVPARADNQVDPMFLKAMHDKGLSMADSTALTLAHGTCNALSGGGVNAALGYLKKNSNLSDKDIVKFGGLAVYAYCPSLAPK